MDIIPYARLIIGLFSGGLVFFVFNKVFVEDMLTEATMASIFSSGPLVFLVMIWHALPIVMIFGSALLLLVGVQKRRTFE